MLTAPNSEIYLLKTPIELDNNNQLNFASAAAQQTYFQGLPKLNITEATFQRKDGTLRWPGNMESVLGYNYCMYRNKNHGNKWFYAFVEDIAWLSENSCAIKLKTDVWQTYQFNLNWHPCFVEREHVNDDTFGKHTIPEGLEYGEYIVKDYTKVNLNADLDHCSILIQISDYPEPMASTMSHYTRIYNGIPQGCFLVGIPIKVANAYNFTSLDNFIRCFDDYGKANAIVSMFLVPNTMVGSVINLTFNVPRKSGTGDPWQFEAFVLPYSTAVTTLVASTTVSLPTTIDGYTPKNRKCLCSPYNYILASNNNGSNVAYAYELFSSTATFTTRGTLTQGCDIKLTPTNYRFSDTSGNYDYSVTCGKFPMLSWNSDYYLNWVAVNGPITEVKAGLTALSFGVSLFAGMIGGDFSGANITGLASDVGNIMQQIREAEMTPNSAKGNASGGDINFTLNETGFKLYRITVREEYIKMIDDYFQCYGYKVNTLKNPNISGRTNWNYVKTVGCNVTGDIPQEDLREIRGLFDRGITIWHNPSTFLDYSQSNTIVS